MAQSLITILRWRLSCFIMVVGVLILLQSRQAFGQVIFGDPTSTIGGPNRFSFSVGGGGVINQKFKFDGAPLTYVTPTRTLVFEGEEASVKFKGEHIFLTGTYRLGAATEVFLTVGQVRLKDKEDLFDGEFGMFWGGGIRISPPQPGPFKVGLVLQGFSGKTKDESFDVLLSGLQSRTDGTVDSITAPGRGEDEIKYAVLNAMIGTSVQYFSSVRPYAGVVFAFIKGTEKGSVSGIGDSSNCAAPAIPPCTFNSGEPFTASWDIDFESETMIGGIIGLQLNPEGPFTITLEGHLGTQDAYFVSAGMQF